MIPDDESPDSNDEEDPISEKDEGITDNTVPTQKGVTSFCFKGFIL